MDTAKKNMEIYPPAVFLRIMDRSSGTGTEAMRNLLSSSKPQRPMNILENRYEIRSLNTVILLPDKY